MIPHLRIARPVSDLARSTGMYCHGLGLEVLGGFTDHDGFDGATLGRAGAHYHFEFTYCRAHPVRPTPTVDDLLVLYLPAEGEWQGACNSMLAAGFKHVASVNPYWEECGRTYEDPDGYRIVLQRARPHSSDD